MIIISCQAGRTVILTLFLTTRTVAAGHRMVDNGWALFKEAIEGTGEGDLPQLLHHLRGLDNTHTTTTTISGPYGCATGEHTNTIASEKN